MKYSVLASLSSIALLKIGLFGVLCPNAWAQVTPDASLRNETSIVVEENSPIDLEIRGGARRGQNIFHSFLEFNVPENGSVYFSDSPNFQRVITRVTGDSTSEILGTLGVIGEADLFLLNPRGIIFGPNARLDVSGSFLATTASAYRFNEQGLFSATSSNIPPLLTIEPSALIFAKTPIAPIRYSSFLSANINQRAFRVPNEVFLVGGDVTLNGGNLTSLDGYVFVGGLNELGAIEITNETEPRLVIQENKLRSNVLFRNNTSISGFGTDIQISANTIRLENSSIIGQPRRLFPSPGILIEGKSLTLTDGSVIQSSAVLNESTSLTAALIPGIQINATEGVFLRNDSLIQTSASFPQNIAGSIGITTGKLQLQDRSSLRASTAGNSVGGNIEILANEVMLTNRSEMLSQTVGKGDAGNITITTDRLDVLNGANISVSTTGSGQAGDIQITADSLEVIGESHSSLPVTISSSINSNAESLGLPTGDAGNILLNVNTLLIQNGGQISVSTSSSEGNGGTLKVEADNVEITSVGNSSSLRSETLDESDAGDIILDTRYLRVLEGGEISAETQGGGRAGDISITSNRIFMGGNARISSTVADSSTTTKRGGRITLNTSQLNLEGMAEILSETESTAPAGVLTIQPNNGSMLSINLGNGGPSISVSTSGNGLGGDLILMADDAIAIQGPGRFTAITTGAGQAGSIEITTGHLTLNDVDFSVESEDNATGAAGDILVTADRAFFQNTNILATPTNVDSGGNITLTISDRLQLTNQSQISASTQSGMGGTIIVDQLDTLDVRNSQISAIAQSPSGTSGSIQVNATDSILLSGRYDEAQSAGIAVSAVGGEAGTLNLDTDSLTVRDQAELSVRNAQTGNAGRLTITADTVLLNQKGRITAETDAGQGGGIRLQIRDSLRLRDHSEIAASTNDGQGGSITLERGPLPAMPPTDVLALSNGSEISTAATGDGNGGRLRFNVERLILENTSSITASAQSGIGGNIIVQQADEIQLSNSAIAASTQTGRAGDIVMNASDSIRLTNGALLSVETRAQANMDALPSGSGDERLASTSALIARRLWLADTRVEENNGPVAGNLEITTGLLEVEDGSRIAVNSPTGQAGNVEIRATRLSLDRGEISAATAINADPEQASANVNIDVLDLLTMENGSLIAAAAQRQANGGNLAINVSEGFITASPNGNNDLIATADRGNGGSIQITTEQLLGFREYTGARDPRQLSTNDMSVTSNLGTDGVLTVNDLGLDPVQGAADLPVDTAPPPLSQGCTPGGGRGRFTNAGQGGIPLGPGDVRGSDRAWEDISPPDRTEAQTITEAQTWTINDQGQVVLDAELKEEATILTCRS